MGLNTTLFTSLSGMTNHSEAISVTGNNIANTSTTGFKASRVVFETQINHMKRNASPPSAFLGGTNAAQIGLGVKIGSIDRNFSTGALQPTGIRTDAAIDGGGFFVMNVNGNQHYTRMGNFGLDRDFNLVSPNTGGFVQGYGIDENFNIIQGPITDLQIPLGSLTLAEATTEVRLAGNLNAGGQVATQNSILTTNAMTDSSTGLPATAASALENLENALGVSLFSIGDVVSLSGIKKGSGTLPPKTFEVGPANTTDSTHFGTTLDDFMGFLQLTLGLQNTADPTVGVAVDPDGQMVITGNTGKSNDLSIRNSDIVVNKTTSPSLPFEMTKVAEADGESVRTTFVAFDSLGNELTMDLTLVLEEKAGNGTQWRFYAESEANVGLPRAVGTGSVAFDSNGALLSVTDPNVTINRQGTGAFPLQDILIRFESPDGVTSALNSTTSQLSALWQDGVPIGTLEDFDIAQDGVIYGLFSNSAIRPMGQILLANFANVEGLREISDGLFAVTANSGLAIIGEPGTGGRGSLIGRTLELSNVELSQEFINLITASTGFSANSRVMTTSDRLMQELLAVVR
ncbi:MAG: flagellar hook-basal body complex protein [Phycisphaeraceae bacterium]|nr:flagellar hook-basal body complex protein [Phycisphaeraceae bacterium]